MSACEEGRTRGLVDGAVRTRAVPDSGSAGLEGCRTRGLGDSRCEPCLPALARDTAGGRAAAGLKGRARHRQAGAWMSRGRNAAREGHQAERRAQVSREGLRDILAGLRDILAGLRRACPEARGDERASSRQGVPLCLGLLVPQRGESAPPGRRVPPPRVPPSRRLGWPASGPHTRPVLASSRPPLLSKRET